ncbi:MAG: response regulator transcription factor [Gemmiger sp.]|nr:response regulator transcription factor [Gemmiger sp.]
MQNIMIVEDDRALSGGIALALQGADIAFTPCYTLAAARQQLFFGTTPFDLLILDCNLPDGNGLALLRQVKAASATPVILLTANDMETDIVTGLEMGADDYITKPFSLAVLRARVNTQLRKRPAPHATAYRQAGFVFDFLGMAFYKNGAEIPLSKTEQKLLHLLVENRGETLPRALLVDRIWANSADYVDENALSVTIKRLRTKLEDTPATPQFIKTVYGIGYTWAVK